MKNHSTIITALALMAMFAMPSSALAGSPLLSGYGGPGAGEQQIVGGGLVGGGRGGSNGGSGGGSSSGSAQSQPAGQTEAAGNGAQQPETGSHGQGHRSAAAAGKGMHNRSDARSPRRSSSASGAGARRSNGSTQKRPATNVRAIELASATSTLGLSGSDVLMVVSAAVALIAIAAATWWLNRSRVGAHRPIEVP